MLKKTLVLLGIFLLLVTGVAFAEDNITVMVNGEPLVFDVPPQELPVYDENGDYVGDRVMVPLRAVGEALNCDVHWIEENQGILLYRKDTLTSLWVGKQDGFRMDGFGVSKHAFMDVPPTVIDDRTLVPVRAVSELLDGRVDWIEETNTVTIDCDLGEWEENEGVAPQCEAYNHLLYMQYDMYTAYFNQTIPTVTGRLILEDDKKIEFNIYPDIAPETAARFILCAVNGFYDDTVFHRVIDGFVAQGGGFTLEGKKKELKEKDPSEYDPLPGEFLANNFVNLFGHKRGVLSFARTNDVNGGGTQFFICHQDAPHLDGYYASFGEITEGMEIVDEICKSETDENDTPVKPIIVKSVEIDLD